MGKGKRREGRPNEAFHPLSDTKADSAVAVLCLPHLLGGRGRIHGLLMNMHKGKSDTYSQWRVTRSSRPAAIIETVIKLNTSKTARQQVTWQVLISCDVRYLSACGVRCRQKQKRVKPLRW